MVQAIHDSAFDQSKFVSVLRDRGVGHRLLIGLRNLQSLVG
jgi:hypothetical protein